MLFEQPKTKKKKKGKNANNRQGKIRGTGAATKGIYARGPMA